MRINAAVCDNLASHDEVWCATTSDRREKVARRLSVAAEALMGIYAHREEVAGKVETTRASPFGTAIHPPVFASQIWNILHFQHRRSQRRRAENMRDVYCLPARGSARSLIPA